MGNSISMQSGRTAFNTLGDLHRLAQQKSSSFQERDKLLLHI
jgi:hypothetical protein